MKSEDGDEGPESCLLSRQVISELKIELLDLQFRVTTGNVLKFLILGVLIGIWGTLLFKDVSW